MRGSGVFDWWRHLARAELIAAEFPERFREHVRRRVSCAGLLDEEVGVTKCPQVTPRSVRLAMPSIGAGAYGAAKCGSFPARAPPAWAAVLRCDWLSV